MTLHLVARAPDPSYLFEPDMSYTRSTTEDVSCLTRGDIEVGVI